jgi:AcrR family transcriptional regulator
MSSSQQETDSGGEPAALVDSPGPDPVGEAALIDREAPSLIDLMPRRGPRRSRARQPSLSREQIVRAAVELADADGAEAISMRRIAARLGVGAMTLYGYVADRDALVAYMINEVVAEQGPLPDRPSGDWRADLEFMARWLRAICRKHPWLPAELGSLPFFISPKLLAEAEFALAVLEPRGLDPRTAGAVLRMINNYVVGTVLREPGQSPTVGIDDSPASQAAITVYLQQIAASGRYPYMSQMARIVTEGRDLDADESFELGLRCLLDGVALLLADRAC